jgi:hypothetical protein
LLVGLSLLRRFRRLQNGPARARLDLDFRLTLEPLDRGLRAIRKEVKNTHLRGCCDHDWDTAKNGDPVPDLVGWFVVHIVTFYSGMNPPLASSLRHHASRRRGAR